MATKRSSYIPPHLRGLVAESGGEQEISVTIKSTIKHTISIEQKTTVSPTMSAQVGRSFTLSKPFVFCMIERLTRKVPSIRPWTQSLPKLKSLS